MRSRVLGSLFRERVLVTLKGGDVFDGMVHSVDAKALELRYAKAVGAGENKSDLPLDGALTVLLPDVAFIQRP